jgi:hypothetical protein
MLRSDKSDGRDSRGKLYCRFGSRATPSIFAEAWSPLLSPLCFVAEHFICIYLVSLSSSCVPSLTEKIVFFVASFSSSSRYRLSLAFTHFFILPSHCSVRESMKKKAWKSREKKTFF